MWKRILAMGAIQIVLIVLVFMKQTVLRVLELRSTYNQMENVFNSVNQTSIQ